MYSELFNDGVILERSDGFICVNGDKVVNLSKKRRIFSAVYFFMILVISFLLFRYFL